MNLPVGFRFDPTVEELLFYYLQRKVKGEPLPPDVVPECDIYGDKEPWKVFDENLKESFYAFTKLKKKSELRVERKAGCGTWVGRQTNEIKDDSGQHVVAFDKYFIFGVEKGSRCNGYWVMHEFSLANKEFNDCVICEIRNKDSTDKDKALVKDLKDHINTSDEQLVRATKSHVKTQGNGSQIRSKKRNLNPGEKTQQQKKKRISSTMDNIDVENRKDNGYPSVLSSNLILEPTPIQELEPGSSPNFDYIANLFDAEDTMHSYLPPLNLITEPAQARYMRPTSSSYDNYTAYEFGKDMMDPCMTEPYLPQPSVNLEPVPPLEWTPMMLEFDLETREAIDAVLQSYWDDQLPMQVSENLLPTPTGLTIQASPVNGNFQT